MNIGIGISINQRKARKQICKGLNNYKFTDGDSNHVILSATLTEPFEPGEITGHGHCWGTTKTPDISGNNIDHGILTETEFISNISGLTPYTNYYIRPFIKKGTKVLYGKASLYYSEAPKQLIAPPGNGTILSPYLISSAHHLNWAVAEETNVPVPGYEQRMCSYYRIENDINMEKTYWDSYGSGGFAGFGKDHSWYTFRGQIDGQGHTLYNLKSMKYTNGGPCGFINITADGGPEIALKRLHIRNGSMQSYDSPVGGMVGVLRGVKVEECSYQGKIIASGNNSLYAGGFAGYIDNSEVQNSYSLPYIIKDNHPTDFQVGIFGGIAKDSLIKYCYGSGQIIDDATGEVFRSTPFCGIYPDTPQYRRMFSPCLLDKETAGPELYYDENNVRHGTACTASYGAVVKHNYEFSDKLILKNYGFDYKGSGNDIWNIGNGRNNGYPYLCNEYPNDPEIVFDEPLVEIEHVEIVSSTPTTITYKGKVKSINGATLVEIGYVVGEYHNPLITDIKTTLPPVGVNETFNSNYIDLAPGTTYYARPYAKYGNTYIYGEEIQKTASNPYVNVVPSGSGTDADPYLISTLEHLNWIASTDSEIPSPGMMSRLSKVYSLQNDIDASASKLSSYNNGAGFKCIGSYDTASFSGKFNGNGHTIYNVYVDKGSTKNQVGFFGSVSSAIITDLHLKNVEIKGYNGTGGFIGYLNDSLLNGKISGCSVTGKIISGQNSGGFIGILSKGKIEDCFSWVSVYKRYDTMSEKRIGGFIGSHNSTDIQSYMKRCLSFGPSFIWNTTSLNYFIEYDRGFGGGSALGGDTTYNTFSCFWNTETSSATSSTKSPGAGGLSSNDMLKITTFLDFGFDFSTKTHIGKWNIGNNRNAGYPYLANQYPDDPTLEFFGNLLIADNTTLKISQDTIQSLEA